MSEKESVLDKIKKLLRLTSSSNQHESQLAMERAQELALRHGIDISGVDSKEPDASEIIQEQADYRRTTHGKFAGAIVLQFWPVKAVKAATVLFWIGTREDVQMARYVYEFLMVEFPRLWKMHQRAEGLAVNSRGDYFYGLYRGLSQKLKKNKDRILAQEQAARGHAAMNSYALAVRNKDVALAKAMRKLHPNTRSSGTSRVSIRNHSVVASGEQAGRQINLNRPVEGVGNRKQLG